eukprot:PhM_4_TR7931/c0_g1_i1/m.57781
MSHVHQQAALRRRSSLSSTTSSTHMSPAQSNPALSRRPSSAFRNIQRRDSNLLVRPTTSMAGGGGGASAQQQQHLRRGSAAVGISVDKSLPSNRRESKAPTYTAPKGDRRRSTMARAIILDTEDALDDATSVMLAMQASIISPALAGQGLEPQGVPKEAQVFVTPFHAAHRMYYTTEYLTAATTEPDIPTYDFIYPESLYGPYFEPPDSGVCFADKAAGNSFKSVGTRLQKEWDAVQRMPCRDAADLVLRQRRLMEIGAEFETFVIRQLRGGGEGAQDNSDEFVRPVALPNFDDGVYYHDVASPTRVALFGTIDAAIAHAKGEIRAIRTLLSSPPIPNLHIPLCCYFEFGTRPHTQFIFASAVMPLGGTSNPLSRLLKLGSVNGRDTVSEPSTTYIAHRLAELFNISSVGGNVGASTVLPLDVKIVMSKHTQTFYILDAAHLWSAVQLPSAARDLVIEKEVPKFIPESHPLEDDNMAHTFLFVRPELQLLYGPNGVTVFPHIPNTRLTPGHASSTWHLLSTIHQTLIPRVLASLTREAAAAAAQQTGNAADGSSYQALSISEIFHSHGVNLRYMGCIAKELENKLEMNMMNTTSGGGGGGGPPQAQDVLKRLKIEMTARTFKSFVRSAHLLSSTNHMMDIMDFFFLLLSNTPSSAEFWKHEIRPRMKEKFGYEGCPIVPERLKTPQQQAAAQAMRESSSLLDPSQFGKRMTKGPVTSVRASLAGRAKYPIVHAGSSYEGRQMYRVDATKITTQTTKTDSHPIVMLAGCEILINQSVVARAAELMGLSIATKKQKLTMLGLANAAFGGTGGMSSATRVICSTKVIAGVPSLLHSSDTLWGLVRDLTIPTDGVTLQPDIDAMAELCRETIADTRKENQTYFTHDTDTRKARGLMIEVLCSALMEGSQLRFNMREMPEGTHLQQQQQRAIQAAANTTVATGNAGDTSLSDTTNQAGSSAGGSATTPTEAWLQALEKLRELRGRRNCDLVNTWMELEVAELCTCHGNIEAAEAHLVEATINMQRDINGTEPTFMYGEACFRVSKVLAEWGSVQAHVRAMEYAECAIAAYESSAHPNVAAALHHHALLLHRWVKNHKCAKCSLPMPGGTKPANPASVAEVVCNACDAVFGDGSSGGFDDTESRFSGLMGFNNTVSTKTVALGATTTSTHTTRLGKTKRERLEEASRQAAALAAATVGKALHIHRVQLSAETRVRLLDRVAPTDVVTRKIRYMCRECAAATHARTLGHDEVVEPLFSDVTRVLGRALKLRTGASSASSQIIPYNDLGVSRMQVLYGVLLNDVSSVQRGLNLARTLLPSQHHCIFEFELNVVETLLSTPMTSTTTRDGITVARNISKVQLAETQIRATLKDIISQGIYDRQPEVLDRCLSLALRVAHDFNEAAAPYKQQQLLLDILVLVEQNFGPSHHTLSLVLKTCVQHFVALTSDRGPTTATGTNGVTILAEGGATTGPATTATMSAAAAAANDPTVNHSYGPDGAVIPSSTNGPTNSAPQSNTAPSNQQQQQQAPKTAAQALYHTVSSMMSASELAGTLSRVRALIANLCLRWIRSSVGQLERATSSGHSDSTLLSSRLKQHTHDIREALAHLLESSIRHLSRGDSADKSKAKQIVTSVSALVLVPAVPSSINANKFIGHMVDLVSVRRQNDDDAEMIMSRTQALISHVRKQGKELKQLCAQWHRHSDSRDVYARKIWADIVRIRDALKLVPRESRDAGVLNATRAALEVYSKTFCEKIVLESLITASENNSNNNSSTNINNNNNNASAAATMNDQRGTTESGGGASPE